MEQGTASQPNPASLDRLTGKAVFFPAGSPGGTDLGDIEMHKLELGLSREKFRLPVTRSVLMDSEDVIAIAPVFSIEGRQFHTALLPLLLLGRRDSDFAQSAVTSLAVTFTARGDQVFDLNVLNVTGVVVSVGTATMFAGIDYFLEANRGLIRLPSEAAGISDGDIVTVRFNQPALVLESFTAFSDPDRPGVLKLWEMDSKSSTPKAVWSMPGNFTVDTMGDGDPAKHRKWKVRFALSDVAKVLRRRRGIALGLGPDLSNALVDELGNPLLDENGNYLIG